MVGGKTGRGLFSGVWGAVLGIFLGVAVTSAFEPLPWTIRVLASVAGFLFLLGIGWLLLKLRARIRKQGGLELGRLYLTSHRGPSVFSFDEMADEMERELQEFYEPKRRRELLDSDPGTLRRMFSQWCHNATYSACAILGFYNPSLNANVMLYDGERKRLEIKHTSGFYLGERAFHFFRADPETAEVEGKVGEAIRKGQVVYVPRMEGIQMPPREPRYLKSLISIPVCTLDELQDGAVAALNIDFAREQSFEDETLRGNVEKLRKHLRNMNHLYLSLQHEQALRRQAVRKPAGRKPAARKAHQPKLLAQ